MTKPDERRRGSIVTRDDKGEAEGQSSWTSSGAPVRNVRGREDRRLADLTGDCGTAAAAAARQRDERLPGGRS